MTDRGESLFEKEVIKSQIMSCGQTDRKWGKLEKDQ